MCRRSEIQEKVYSNVEIVDLGYETECHIWQGSNSGNGRGGGYPRMCLSGHTVAVHRVMYTQLHGYIPGKKQIDHKCRNRMCVNPNHLEMVTHKQNQRRRDDARFSDTNDDDTSNRTGMFVSGFDHASDPCPSHRQNGTVHDPKTRSTVGATA